MPTRRVRILPRLVQNSTLFRESTDRFRTMRDDRRTQNRAPLLYPCVKCRLISSNDVLTVSQKYSRQPASTDTRGAIGRETEDGAVENQYATPSYGKMSSTVNNSIISMQWE